MRMCILRAGLESPYANIASLDEIMEEYAYFEIK